MSKVIRLPSRAKPRAVKDAPRTADNGAPEIPTPIKPGLSILEQQLAVLAEQPIGNIGAVYLQIRDKKRKYEEQAEAEGKKLAVLDRAVLAYLQKENLTSFTAEGMVIGKYTLTTVRITDAGEARTFILEDPAERLDLLEMKGSKSGMQNFQDKYATVDENGEVVKGPLPPGMEYNEFIKVGVRKK